MSLFRAATSISAFTLLSRVLGLVRDVVTSHVLGSSWVNGVLQLAWMMPNLLRRLLGEGALAAAFVPAYTQRLSRGSPVAARALLASVTGGLLAFLGLFCAAVVLTTFVLPPDAWHLPPALANDPAGPATSAEVGALLSKLLAVLFPYALPICLLGLLAGAQHSLGVFATTAAAPALLNVFGLAGLFWASAVMPGDLPAIAQTLAWFLAAGGLAQLALGVAPLVRRGAMPMPRMPRRGDGSGDVIRTMLPTVLGMSLVQFNVLIDQGLAAWLIGVGSNYHISLANRLLLFPHALVALPLATAVFPTLAAHASRDDFASMRERLDTAATATLFLAIPATVGLALLADALLDVAFVHGMYTTGDATTTRWTTTALVAGLPALGLSQLAARALFAFGDTRTPARASSWLVVVNLLLNLTFLLLLGMGVAGLTAATTCCTYLNAWALCRAVRRRCGRTDRVTRTALRATLASAVMALAIVGFRALMPDLGGRLATGVLHLALPIAIGIATYLGVQISTGSPELRIVLDRLRARSE